MTKTFDRVRETVHSRTLENGLRVCCIDKPGFSKTFAMLATNFGSCDASFTFEGARHDIPAGVAHFLEHKMFECEDGNALQKFAATGASPNAFTSHTMTAYHFSCTERFEENLKILLNFVFTPYFTEENVQKERGIIGQEIGMLDDTPGWQAFVGLYEGFFREHPIRVSIAGSVESIAGITPALLTTCHRAFYAPSNMALVVCGTADFEAICRTAEELTPTGSSAPALRHYGTRRDTVNQSEIVRHMAVSQPQMQLGFKDVPLAPGESRLRRQFLGDLCCRILCGPTAPLYARLFDERLITPAFETEYTIFPEGAAATLGGESRDPRALRRMVEDAVRQYAAFGVDADYFTRVKNAAFGMYLRVLDDPGAYCREQVNAVFAGEDFADFAAIADKLTAADAQELFARWAQDGRSTLSLVLPPERSTT